MLHRRHMGRAAVPAPLDRVDRVQPAGEDHHLRILRQFRRREEVDRELPDAMPLEGRDPALRPELHTTRRAPRHEALLEDVFLRRALRIGEEFLAQRCQLADRETVERGLAQPLERGVRVAGQDHVVGVAIFEHRIEIAGHDHVEVEKQHRPRQIAQIRAPQPRLAPDALTHIGHVAIEFGQRHCGDTRIEPLERVGEAVEIEGRRHMARDHSVEAVDVIDAVFLAPADTDDLFLHATPF